jgi:hypothetical protein
LSDYLRFLVTVDAASGAPVKVEQVGEAGDLTEVDMPSFVSSLGGAGASGPLQPQVVINIFGGAAAESLAAGAESAQRHPGPPPRPGTNICFPPRITPPKRGKPKK